MSTSTELDRILSGTSFISEWSLFSDDVWILPSKVVTAQRNHIYWITEHGEPAVFADPRHARLLESSKQLVRYVLLRGALRGRIRSRTVMDFWASLRQLIKWMISLGLSAFSDLNIDLIAAYKSVVIDSGVTAERAQRRLYPFKVLAIASAELDDCVKIPVYVLDEMLAIQHVTSYECKTAIIPDAVALPLISEALHIIERQSQLLIDMYEFDWKSRSQIRAECEALSFTEAAAFSRLRQAHEKRYAGYTLVYSDGQSVDLSKMSNLNECVLLLETACFVVLAAFVGMRVSELGSLQTGCLSTIRSERGLELLLVNGIIFKTSRVDEGSPQQWVAGWDGADNVVRKAVSILERLRSAEGAVEGTPRYLLTAQHGRFKHGEGKPLKTEMFILRANAFGSHCGFDDWHFTTHQFRLFFARWVTRTDPNALLALRRHFGHISIQMTEYYSFWDAELIDAVLDADFEQDYEALDIILSSEHLSGAKGREIAQRNQRFRGVAGAIERQRYIEAELKRPSDDQLIIMRHDYGYCIFLAETAACGGDRWRVGFDTCASCPNAVFTREHQPFLERHREARVHAMASAGFQSLSTQDRGAALDDLNRIDIILDGLR